MMLVQTLPAKLAYRSLFWWAILFDNNAYMHHLLHSPPHFPQTPRHSPQAPPCWSPTEVMQRVSVETLPAAVEILELPMLTVDVRASSSSAAAAPFQKLA